MFKRKKLQSKSEVLLRNIVVTAIVIFNICFVILPIGIAFVGSFHQWNPLKGTYNYLGFENYKNVFTNKLFWKSMGNTVIFTFFAVTFRVILGLAIIGSVFKLDQT